jgi:hypothetical protein
LFGAKAVCLGSWVAFTNEKRIKFDLKIIQASQISISGGEEKKNSQNGN